MLTPETTTIIMCALTFFLLVVIPCLDSSKRFSKYISLRYTLTGVFTVLAAGCVLDFSHLSDETRRLVIIGGIILAAVFVAMRSIEKIRFGGNLRLKGEYKDIKGELNYTSNGDDNDSTKNAT